MAAIDKVRLEAAVKDINTKLDLETDIQAGDADAMAEAILAESKAPEGGFFESDALADDTVTVIEEIGGEVRAGSPDDQVAAPTAPAKAPAKKEAAKKKAPKKEAAKKEAPPEPPAPAKKKEAAKAPAKTKVTEKNTPAKAKVTKKSIVIRMVSCKKGATLEEIGKETVKQGVDDDLAKNIKTAKLWMRKLGFEVTKNEKTGEYRKV